MIGFIEGIIDSVEDGRLTVNVNGVGYEMVVSNSVISGQLRKGDTTRVLTYLYVREDAMQLFGFSSREEKALFLHLISVSGIGPKSAMTVLSAFEIKKLVVAITKGDLAYLTSVPGIGKKTAERIVVELKEKLAKAYSVDAQDNMLLSGEDTESSKDAVSALMALGYSAKEARTAVMESIEKSGEAKIEDIIKSALRSLS